MNISDDYWMLEMGHNVLTINTVTPPYVPSATKINQLLDNVLEAEGTKE